MLLHSKESQEPGTGWKLCNLGTRMGIFDPGPGGGYTTDPGGGMGMYDPGAGGGYMKDPGTGI
ncbi:hypothetical protein [Bacillus wiedmannii]|uniref:hypothetical protein n=1 Tax=Bacillus wiedmannii TaxID=1890302 RepID=UPI000D097314|nr:hypothetical protein [Bacillus wiedmannii]PRT19765.1 hypothetical protein C6360_20285 [Bacillus wiedmannii]